MSIFTFRARSADRDRETDSRRFRSLCSTLDDLLDQINKEERGLRRRYERVRDQAAFALQSLDNGGARGMSAKVDDLTRSLGQCEARLTALKAQADFVAALRERAGAQPDLWK